MSSTDLCAVIRDGLPSLYECTPAPREGVRVRTPMMYPDGGIVDVFVLERGGSYTLTDFGEALAWLRMQTSSPRRTPKQLRLIEDVCQTLGVKLIRGQLVLRSHAADELSETVTRLAQAVVRVSDIWFTMRTKVSAVDEVREWLVERHIEFKADVRYKGSSGREWTIDFQTYSAPRTSLVFLLSARDRAMANRITNNVFVGCADLNDIRVYYNDITTYYLPPTFVSLFDDTSDVWQDEDFRLLSRYSEVAYWSRPERLEEILRAA